MTKTKTTQGSLIANHFSPLPDQKTFDQSWEGYIQLRSPLMHGGDRNFGTTRLFRTQKIVGSDGQIKKVPVYNGGAVRGLFRDIAALQLLTALEIRVPPHVFDFLTSGGSLTLKGTTIDVGLARELRNIVPMIGLFGGGVGNQIIEGKLIFLQGMPICADTIHLLPSYCAGSPSADLSIRDLRQFEYGTRRDDKKREGNQPYIEGPVAERKDGDVATQMKYETETLAPGTCLRFGFIANKVTAREWSTFLMTLAGFLKKPFLGGRSAVGYGEVAVPTLYRARRQARIAGEVEADTDDVMATVTSDVDLESRLQLVAEQIENDYRADVQSRRDEIQSALARVV